MTTTTRYRTECPTCYDTSGEIHMRENDAPFSAPYESYTFNNLGVKSSSFRAEPYAEWKAVFAECRPYCLKCGTVLNPDDIQVRR
jgi:hypothetical protein